MKVVGITPIMCIVGLAEVEPTTIELNKAYLLAHCFCILCVKLI